MKSEFKISSRLRMCRLKDVNLLVCMDLDYKQSTSSSEKRKGERAEIWPCINWRKGGKV